MIFKGGSPGHRRFQIFFAVAVMAWSQFASAQQLVFSFSASTNPVTAGNATTLWLNALNPSDQPVALTFPDTIKAQIVSEKASFAISLALPTAATANSLTNLAPGSFVRREYIFHCPTMATGRVILECSNFPAAPFVLDVLPPQAVATLASKEKSAFQQFLQDAEPTEAGQPFDPTRYFKQHFAPYEPIYFIAGSTAPTAKFQFSFQYQLVSETGWLAQHVPISKDFHFAYTQVSLWDLAAPSAPFFDTSYKPALIYSQDRLLGGATNDWFQLDLVGGAQHESNGKNGVDSRSMNIVFLKPSLTFGRDDRLQLTLQPRVWSYISDLDDNPDIDEYRGYFDLRAVLGWRRGLQLSALGRMGHEGNHTSLQLDLTYPTMRFFNSFSFYLQAQYFTGYGESLLRYNERTDVFRIGFSLYR